MFRVFRLSISLLIVLDGPTLAQTAAPSTVLAAPDLTTESDTIATPVSSTSASAAVAQFSPSVNWVLCPPSGAEAIFGSVIEPFLIGTGLSCAP